MPTRLMPPLGDTRLLAERRCGLPILVPLGEAFALGKVITTLG